MTVKEFMENFDGYETDTFFVYEGAWGNEAGGTCLYDGLSKALLLKKFADRLIKKWAVEEDSDNPKGYSIGILF